MIKTKSVLANFGSEKQFKVKQVYFMTTEINPFLTNTSFLNEGKVKFLQMKQGNIRQKHEKDRVITYVHMRRDTPLSLYAPVNILDDPHPSNPPVA